MHYYSSSISILQQLEQLQLFAMHQKITGQIDSTYTAQSHSLETLRDWHMQNSHVSILVLSSQVIFPVFASIFLALYLFYLIELEPVNFGKKLNSQADDDSPDEIKNAALSKVWIIVTISILFTAGTVATDIGALVEYAFLPEEIKSYFNDHSNNASVYLYVVPIIMLFFDFLSLLLFIIIGPNIMVACCKHCYRKCTQESTSEDKQYKPSYFLYTLISPLSCIATHSYHIIFAFINNPYHATSVLLFYIMTLLVVVVIFQKTYYFVVTNNCFKKSETATRDQRDNTKAIDVGGTVIGNPEAVPSGTGATSGGTGTTSGDQGKTKTNGQRQERYILVISFTAVIIALAICIGLTVAVLIALPINNAIDLASTEIYAIYQASVTVFAALVTFEVVFRPTNSIFAVLIKAADKRAPKPKNGEKTKWGKMSEKEKEICLGDQFLSHIKFDNKLLLKVADKGAKKSNKQTKKADKEMEDKSGS
jgi:hypothetical protein